MKLSEKYNFICIEGNIGSGKTTLVNMLGAEYPAWLLLEQFAENPFLADFYRDKERYAFPVEVFFLSERHKQMVSEVSNASLFNDQIIADYCFQKTALFARQNLNNSEYGVFYKLFLQLHHNLVQPDLILFLNRPVEVLLQNIDKRNRQYEKLITADYLDTINQAYMAFLQSVTDIPVVIVQLGDGNFASDSKLYGALKNIIQNESLQAGPTNMVLKPD